MELDLSRNWKRLQANLDTRQNNAKGLRTPTGVRQKFEYRRRSIKDRLRNSNNTPLANSLREETEMDVTECNDPVPTTSLTLWAEDNDISTKDLIKAYGIGSKAATVGGPSKDRVNCGLLENVEVGRYVAMDCEMVGVGGDEDRSALVRVSIVNFYGVQVYDSYVRPKETVTDWRTHISGVGPKHMAAARSFEDVQKVVADLLKNRVLVGHSVKHDLEAIMLGHPKSDIRDTSRFSEFRKYSAGKTPSLKRLAKEVLGIDIQVAEHSSIEDARTAMSLFSQHKQAFDAEHARHFRQRTGKIPYKSKSKKRGKNKS